MSTGSAEALRHGLVAHLRERGEERTPLGARVVAALAHVWPADAGTDLARSIEGAHARIRRRAEERAAEDR